MGDAKQTIEEGKATLGIELGSTRIKAVLIGEDAAPIAAGTHEWESSLENGVWTYHRDEVWSGVQDCYRNMAEDVQKRYGIPVTSLAAIGISGMMHGYLPFNKEGRLLAPFRTWRNTITGEAAEALTKEFRFHIPQRWSVAHLYQAILNKEEHVKDIRYLTTLAGYLHWQLTGEKVLGVGEASGMFPIDSKTKDYDGKMLSTFDELIAPYGYPWKLRDLLPKVLLAGEPAGTLTEEGARRLDVTGHLKPGILMCPPEGDAGTGMTATNSVAVRTGNVSAGTSIFAMVVLEKPLRAAHEELDLVTTPTGDAVAMVHCNNGTSDLNEWVGLFGEFAKACNIKTDSDELYGRLYREALKGDCDCGGLTACNYIAGEPVTGCENGIPLFARRPDAKLSLANFMRAHLYASLASLKIGCDILFREEEVKVDMIYGHGGLFRTREVGQRFLAAALDVPVAVMETAGEGGPWGMALLASYAASRQPGEDLQTYLNRRVFANQAGGGANVSVIQPDAAEAKGFARYLDNYRALLAAEKAIDF